MGVQEANQFLTEQQQDVRELDWWLTLAPANTPAKGGGTRTATDDETADPRQHA